MKRAFHTLTAAVLVFAGISSLSADVEVYEGQPTLAGQPYLLANWNFNTGSATDQEALLTVSRGTGTLTHSFVPSSIQAFAGSTVNAFGGDGSGGSLSLQAGSENVNNGAHITFKISTAQFRDLVLTYATQRTNTGFLTQTWSYSTDGENFVATGIVVEPPSTYGLRTVDLSSITAVEDQAEVYLRATFDGGSAASGNNRIDNVQFRGTATTTTAVPVTAAISNASAGSPYSGMSVFASGTTQTMAIAFTGMDATAVTTLAVTLPENWSGLALGNVSLSGSGFSSANAAVSGRTLTISNAAVTEWASGTAILSGLATPAGEAITDWGRFGLLVEGATSGGELKTAPGQPEGNLVLPISLIRQVNAVGVPLALGQRVAVAGVATVGSGVFHPVSGTGSRFSTYLQDDTGGVAIDHPTLAEFWDLPWPGNRYTAIGSISQFNGLTQVSVGGQDDFINHNEYVGEPEPLALTIGELLANAEDLEGSLVRIARATKVAGTWPMENQDTDITIVAAGSAETLNLRINRNTDITWYSTEPDWPIDIVGIFNQFDNSSPFFDGYQILPRSYSDFLPASAPGDGSGSATLVNATPGVFQDTTLFEAGSGQSVALTITGEDSASLQTVSITLPDGWSGLSLGNVALSGPGFSSASASVAGDTVTVSAADVTGWSSGTVLISNLTAPSGEAIGNFGQAEFTVQTALSGGTLTGIALQPTGNQIVPISAIRPVDAQGVPLALNRMVAVEGVATVSSGVFNATRLSSYLQDETAGVAIDHGSPGDFWDLPVLGTRYLAVGVVGQFNGLTQLALSGQEGLINRGAASVPEPQLYTIDQLLANAEDLEGTLVRIARVFRSNPAQVWPSDGNFANITIEDAGGTPFILRINQVTDISWYPEPEFPLDVVGILTQFDTSSPYTAGYQILPRSYADFLPASEPAGGFAGWQEFHFPGADPAISAPGADPDGDGLANLLEFALGGNPLESSLHLLPELAVTPGGVLEITFRRVKEATDVLYAIQASSDLSDWTEIWSSASHPYPSAEEVIEETVADVVPMAGSSRRFLRLVVTLTE